MNRRQFVMSSLTIIAAMSLKPSISSAGSLTVHKCSFSTEVMAYITNVITSIRDAETFEEGVLHAQTIRIQLTPLVSDFEDHAYNIVNDAVYRTVAAESVYGPGPLADTYASIFSAVSDVQQQQNIASWMGSAPADDVGPAILMVLSFLLSFSITQQEATNMVHQFFGDVINISFMEEIADPRALACDIQWSGTSWTMLIYNDSSAHPPPIPDEQKSKSKSKDRLWGMGTKILILGLTGAAAGFTLSGGNPIFAGLGAAAGTLAATHSEPSSNTGGVWDPPGQENDCDNPQIEC